MDVNTTVEKLKKQVSEFRDARDWLRYDTPRSLAISISVEAAELLEHFQWED
jgi:dCTP diphosphatase